MKKNNFFKKKKKLTVIVVIAVVIQEHNIADMKEKVISQLALFLALAAALMDITDVTDIFSFNFLSMASFESLSFSRQW